MRKDQKDTIAIYAKEVKQIEKAYNNEAERRDALWQLGQQKFAELLHRKKVV